MMYSRRNQGITVIEVLIIIAALAIIVVIAFPKSSFFFGKYQVSDTTNNLIKSLSMAQNESLARSSTVRVCPSSNGETCRSDNNWSLGWLVYSDGNGDGFVQEIERLKAFPAPASSIQIHAAGAVTETASFNIAGLQPDHGADSGTFTICIDKSDSAARVIEVETDGYINQVVDAEANC